MVCTVKMCNVACFSSIFKEKSLSYFITKHHAENEPQKNNVLDIIFICTRSFITYKCANLHGSVFLFACVMKIIITTRVIEQ